MMARMLGGLHGLVGLACGVVLALSACPAFAQVDLSGQWAARYHEDQEHRIPGPELGDYLGLPINAAARLKADSWDASILSLREHQAKPHPSTYSLRGPANIRITKVFDPVTQETIGYEIFGTFGQATRTIWLDDRRRLPPYAAHTWAGFSLGHWEGDQLVVETSHLKVGWIQRNGVAHSDQTTMTEHFMRHGDVLTVVTIVHDPVYLEEPFIRSTNWVIDPRQEVVRTQFDVVDEVAAHPTATFTTDKEIFFNGEAIVLSHQPSALRDDNVTVFFRRSDVVVSGDVFTTMAYPAVDPARGGSVQGVIDALNRIIDITIPGDHEEGGTYVVPGHGRLCDEADVVEYRDMLTIIRDRVARRLARPTFDYDARYGSPDAFIEAAYR